MTASASKPATSAEQLLDSLVTSRLMSAAEARQVVANVPADRRRDSKTLVQELVKLQRLTPFQARRLLLGQLKGLVLGSCIVQEELGAGGMGVVFKAVHRGLNKTVAVKVLPPEVTANPAAIKRFRREALACARLSHPNLVAAFDTGEEQGVHFLVLEYVEGCDLAQWVKKHGPMPLPQALDCILQAAAGLGCAHAAGVVHRDVKPHNLILASRGTVKVLDLGLARLDSMDGEHGNETSTDALTKTGSFMGSCDYIAPEQAMNIKAADRRADIYSLGGTLHFLLTGKPMYSGETGMEKVFAHRENPIPTLPGVSRSVQAVFRRMVAKRPEDRYPSMVKVIAALQACSGSSPRRKLARLWLAVGALGVAAVVLLSVAFLGRGSDPLPATKTQGAIVAVEPPMPQTVIAIRPVPPDQPGFRLSQVPARTLPSGGGVGPDNEAARNPAKKLQEMQEHLRQAAPPATTKPQPRS
jgi:hypothetical protein